ncbi:MAG: oligosaccharide flippase family protein [Flavobacteriales bacterium]|nr:oligosaccharide flippase family protein [Flavobacteriales bacterium]
MTRSLNIRNSLWSIFDVTVYPILFFAFTPYFIDRLGEEEYGVWMIANSGVIFSMLLIKPSQQVSTMYVANYLDKGIGEVRQLLHTIWGATIVICTCLTAASGALSLTINKLNLELFSYDRLPELIVSVSVFAFFRLFSEVLIGGLHGFQRHDRAAQVNFCIRIANLSACLIMMHKGIPIYMQFYVWSIIQAIGLIFFFRFFKKEGVGFGIRMKKSNLLAVHNYAKHSLLQNLISIAYFQVDRFIVAYNFGAASAGYYSIVSTIFNQMHRAFEAAISWFFPKMAGYKNDPEKIKKFFLSIRAFSIVFGTLALFAFFYLESTLMIKWLGQKTYDALSPLLPYFILLEFSYLFSISGNLFMLGRNEMRLNTKLEWTYKSLVIGAMFIGAYFGNAPEHVVLSMAIVMAIGMIIYSYVFYRRRDWGSPIFEAGAFLLFIGAIAICITAENIVLHITTLMVSLCLVYFKYFKNHFNKRLLIDG